MTTKEFNRCLRRIKNGDNRGMEPIYHSYFERLKFTASLELQNEADAEDVASNVMLSILRNAAHYRPIEKPNAYMYRALQFAIINFKKNNDKYVYTELMDDIYSAKEEKLDLKIELKRHMEQLTERQREIVQLHYIYGLKIYEAAKIMNVSISTINRELLFLRGDLGEFFKKFENGDTFF